MAAKRHASLRASLQDSHQCCLQDSMTCRHPRASGRTHCRRANTADQLCAQLVSCMLITLCSMHADHAVHKDHRMQPADLHSNC
jgi:hypothetical protein